MQLSKSPLHQSSNWSNREVDVLEPASFAINEYERNITPDEMSFICSVFNLKNGILERKIEIKATENLIGKTNTQAHRRTGTRAHGQRQNEFKNQTN